MATHRKGRFWWHELYCSRSTFVYFNGKVTSTVNKVNIMTGIMRTFTFVDKATFLWLYESNHKYMLVSRRRETTLQRLRRKVTVMLHFRYSIWTNLEVFMTISSIDVILMFSVALTWTFDLASPRFWGVVCFNLLKLLVSIGVINFMKIHQVV